MGQYNIKGGNFGAVGDGAHADHFTQNAQAVDVDLRELTHELEKLTRVARDRAVPAEQFVALSDAETAARNGDKKTAFEKLKSVGVGVLNIAKDIGTEVAAKVIESQLGFH